MSTNKLKPALDLLAERRRTNGYATLEDLARVMGIDPAAPCSYAEMVELSRNVARAPNVVAEHPIGIDDVTKYRLMIPVEGSIERAERIVQARSRS